MSSTKDKKIKKSKITPQWVDEEDSPQVQSPTKRTPEEDAKLFRDAIEFEHIPQKDLHTQTSERHQAKTKKAAERHDIDLHGLTVEEAERHVVIAIESILSTAKGQPVTIRVITGKGHHSPNKKPQLLYAIHRVVESRFSHRLISIEASPHLLKIGDSYLKGHFDLKIR